jgi:hypothetical protein
MTIKVLVIALTCGLSLGAVKIYPNTNDVCSTTADCNYNGDCTSQKCVCDAQWKGTNCDELNLLKPANKKLGYQGKSADGTQNITSW